MKKLLAILLLIGVLLSLCACGGKPTYISAFKSEGEYPELGEEMLSWEGLNALPKKTSGMTTAEARQACVDFWFYMKTALWTPATRFTFYNVREDGVREPARTIKKGVTYAGLPYVSTATGSIYRFMDFLDPATGAVNLTDAGIHPVLMGSMCSSGCFWAWSRVMNSANYGWCKDAVVKNGCLRVGPYTYDDNLPYYIASDYGTDDICKENGEQIMYQSYAAMDMADGLVATWENNNHIMMCTAKPVVVYREDGTIDGKASYLRITEQGGSAYYTTSEGGREHQYEGGFNEKTSFLSLYNGNYLPFTFAELIGTDPIEETEVTFSHTGDTITEDQLFNALVTSNYNISDIYASVFDKKGNEVFKHAVRVRTPSTKEMKISRQLGATFTWGDWKDLDPKKSYTVKVEVQLGTGERPVLWEGKLVL